MIEFLSRPGVAAVSLALIWILESLLPLASDRRDRLRHDIRNLGLGILNAVLTSILFARVTLAVTGWAAAHRMGLLAWASMPDALTWVAALLLMDAWQYWWHRLNHVWPLLWRFHAVHHADAEMDASSCVRFHTGEIMASALVRLAVLPLLGISLPQLVVYEIIAFPVIAFHHANLRWPERWDRWARVVLVTPGVHRVHHSVEPSDYNRNFASVLTWWDRLFGSFRAARDATDQGYGLRLPEAEWKPFLAMLTMPFRPAREDSARDA